MCDAPINIIKRGADICSLKCLLWYKYGNSSCVVNNRSTELVILYDGQSDVLFNSVPYKPIDVRIFKPSLHTYDGTFADGEIVITHKGAAGGLVVCIPIMKSNSVNASTGTNLIHDIITSAPSDKGSTSLNLQDFNLNHIIPKSSYFSYTGTLCYGTCDPKVRYNYVVFPKKDGIALAQKTFDHLGNLIHDSYIPVHEKPCFFNEKGTKSNGFSGEGQIYIDCQPTGEEGEIMFKEVSTPPVNYDWIFAILYIIVGMIIMYGCIKLVRYVWNNLPIPKGLEISEK
jgi:carbonic anhydrase